MQNPTHIDEKNPIRVAELFAGVGGFRIGLERASERYKFVWSNQWEPSTKRQDASDIYKARFGAAGHSNVDIAEVPTEMIPDFDLLVGGFPCQDYSVAKTANQASGIVGKKGVLWWQIHRILKEKPTKPPYLLLENVDRLLKSPAKQRGRDFSIMLASLSDLGYAVEWRVINAADYGMPQRRKRVFFFGVHESSPLFQQFVSGMEDPLDFLKHEATIASQFPIKTISQSDARIFDLEGDLQMLTEQFNAKPFIHRTPFENSGFMVRRRVFTAKTEANFEGEIKTLGDVLVPENQVPKSFFISEEELSRWEYFKGSKKEKRTNAKTGFEYVYNEGAMAFPDALDRPSRTIITGEGGTSASRFKHVIRTASGRYRRLTPIELERLNMFPDDHTKGATDTRRAFLMGNALVVGIVEGIGRGIVEKLEYEKPAI